MKLQLSNGGRAGLVAVTLLSLAVYAVLGFQHGFEEQVGWYVTLLPGAIVAAGISDLVPKAIPNAKLAIFWGLLICLDFLWYFVISLTVVKIWRFVSPSKNTDLESQRNNRAG